MTNLSGSQRRQTMQSMFARIAPHYDRMNRLMTAGQDKRWRQEVIRRAGLAAGEHLLDLGAGTGDLADEALRLVPGSRVIAADLTIEMMQAGRALKNPRLSWAGTDALHLPFPEQSFDAVVSGYLLRNVSDINQVLNEHRRVLKPGGRIVALDTTRPPSNILSPFIQFHLHTVIPTLGRLLAGDVEAYTYLPKSTQDFLFAEQLATRMLEAGFRQVGFRRLMFGTMAIHWGVK